MSIDLDEMKWQLSEKGFSEFPETVYGWNYALVNPELAEYAVSELGYDAHSISEECGYKIKAVERVLVHHGILKRDETSLTEFEYKDAVKWNPTRPKPNPSAVYRPQGTADQKPEGWS
jgi:hypothetical protein